MQYIFAFLFVTVIGLTSCDSYKEIKGEDLKNAFILNSSPTFKGYYFKGSDSAFHYFVSKWDFKKDRYFKIASGNMKVIRDFKFNTGSKELMISLSEENSEEFAENNFYKLYLLKTKQ
jgi:hypothetical protein